MENPSRLKCIVQLYFCSARPVLWLLKSFGCHCFYLKFSIKRNEIGSERQETVEEQLW